MTPITTFELPLDIPMPRDASAGLIDLTCRWNWTPSLKNRLKTQNLLLSTSHEYQEKTSDRESQDWSYVCRCTGCEDKDNAPLQTGVRDLQGNKKTTSRVSDLEQAFLSFR